MMVQVGLIAFALVVILVTNYLLATTDSGLMVIGMIMAVIMAGWVVLNPDIGLYLLTMFVYVNLSSALEETLGIPSINKPLVALILVSVLANRFVLHRKPFVFRASEVSILLYLIVVIISVMSATADQSQAMERLTDLLKDVALLIIILQLCDREKVWKAMLWTLIGSAAFLSVLSWYHSLLGGTDNNFFGLANFGIHQITETFDNARVSGPLSDPNFYGQMLMMVLPLAAYRAFAERRQIPRLIGMAAALLILGAVIFTYSRGAFLALGVVTLLIIYERRYKIINFLFIGFVAVSIIMPLLPPGYIDRILTLGDILPGSGDAAINEDSFRGRASEFIIGVQMFLDYPILGVGKGNYQALYIEYSSRLGLDSRLEARQAHNIYLETLAETGILGFGTFMIMLITMLATVLRAMGQFRALARPDLLAWSAAIGAGLLSFMITSFFLHNDYARYFWLIIALAASTTVLSEALTAQEVARRRAAQSGSLLPTGSAG